MAPTADTPARADDDHAPHWSPASPVEEARILFTGDLGFGLSYRNAHGTRLDDLYEAPFADLRTLLTSADLTIPNLETVFTSRRDSPLAGTRPYLHYDDPAEGPAALRALGIAVVSYANNHVMDMGEPGFLDTLDALERHGIEVVGAGRTQQRADAPLTARIPFTNGSARSVIVFSGFRTSSQFAAATGSLAGPESPGCAALRDADITAQIRTARAADPHSIIVVVPHWRRDYKWASDAQRRFAHRVTAAGADLVIGHGSHMAQEIDLVDGRPQIHGLGNFVFNSKGRYTKLGVPPYSLAARLQVAPDSASLRLHPLHTDNRRNGFRGHPVTEEQFAEFLATAAERTADRQTFDASTTTGTDEVGHYLEIDLPPAASPGSGPHSTGIPGSQGGDGSDSGSGAQTAAPRSAASTLRGALSKIRRRLS